MAKQVKNSDLVQGKLWEPTIKETESLITVLDKLEQSFKDVSKASSQAAKKADPGSAKGISTINEELEKQKRIKSELSKVDKQREAAESRLRVAQSKQGQDLERTNQRLLRQRQANRALAKETDTLNSAYGRSSARLTRLTKKYKDLEFQNKGNTKEAKRLLRQITFLDAKLKATDKTVGQSGRVVGEYERGFKGLGKGIGSAIGPMIGITAAVAGVTAGLRASLGLFREFGLASAKVQAITGDTSGSLVEQAKSLGVSTAFTASNVAELQLNLSKLGFTTKQIEESTESILNFALATDSELGRAAEVTASTLNAFNLEASEAGRISDVASKAFNSTALDIEKFATAIAVVGPAANARGVSIEKTTAILGKIVDAGIDASTAGSALRNVFIDISDKGISLDDALNQIATSQNKLSTANELFGKRGAVVATVIADNVDEIDQLDKSLLNAAGSADAASAIIGDTLDGDIKKFTSSIQGLILGNSGLAKSLRGIIQGFTRLIRLFSDTDEAAKNLIDSNLEQLETSEANIAKNTELADTYKELSSQENLTAEETEILNGVKGELLSTFDDSIAKINEETGAIEI
ncbi:MAG: phage tail tape measure protein, partial [Gammaproteobacteria bacterium]|nr:phage tail tape measure protein [Gammaproteobacteria bacterium]